MRSLAILPSGSKQRDLMNEENSAFQRWPLAVAGLVGLAWIVMSAWFVQRLIGWTVVPQLLPHEIGGMIAGLAAPLALIFAVAALVERGQRAHRALARLETQIERLSNPHAAAESGLREVVRQLHEEAASLQVVVDRASASAANAGDSFAASVQIMTEAADHAVARTPHGGEALRAQAESLAQTVHRISGQLETIQEVSAEQAGVVENAGQVATAGVRSLTVALERQAQETVGRLEGIAAGAGDRVAAAAAVALAKAEELADALAHKTNEAGAALESMVGRVADRVTGTVETAATRASDLTWNLEQQVGEAGKVFEEVIERAAERMGGATDSAVAESRGLAHELEQRASAVAGALDAAAATSAALLTETTAAAAQRLQDLAEAFGQQATDAARHWRPRLIGPRAALPRAAKPPRSGCAAWTSRRWSPAGRSKRRRAKPSSAMPRRQRRRRPGPVPWAKS